MVGDDSQGEITDRPLESNNEPEMTFEPSKMTSNMYSPVGLKNDGDTNHDNSINEPETPNDVSAENELAPLIGDKEVVKSSLKSK